VVGDSSSTENPVTPRLGLSWQPDHDSLYYATAASGYRVGNLNADVGPICGPDLASIGLSSAPSTSRSDSLWSYELGAKNAMLNRTLQANLSLFLVDWKDIQQSVYLPTCGLQYSANLGRARSHGGDLELTYRPTSALLLYLDAAYTDAKYTGTVCSSASVDCTSPGSPFRPIVSEGDRLPGAPWSFVASVEYSWALGADSKPYARVDYQYSTAQTALVPVQNPNNGLSDPTQLGLPLIQNLGLRVGWRHDGFDLSLFGQNLTNDNPVIFRTRDIAAPFDQTFFSRGMRPRSFGMTGTWHF
jgi:iron complex outermembrane receptor protein